jgi:hypothetical protein
MKKAIVCGMTADTLSFAKRAAGSDFFASTISVYSTKSFCEQDDTFIVALLGEQ